MRGLPVLLCLVLAACAGQQPPQPGNSPSTTSPTSDSATTPAPLPPTSTPLPTPTTLPSRALEPGMTVRGVVSPGVESGCLLLDTGTAQYLLLGADPAIAVAGAEVEVTGQAEPGGMTTCQQGTPFRVERTARVSP